LLVFYFIFVAVGFVLMQEKREERKRRELEDRMALRARSGLGRRDEVSTTTQ
jgi:hypothetical protein